MTDPYPTARAQIFYLKHDAAGGWGLLPLPIVGIWMLPVGLALLAHDIPMMRRPMARLLQFTNRQIEKRKS